MITKDLLKFLKLFHSTRQIPFGREWFGPTEEALSPNITNQKFFRPKCRTDRILVYNLRNPAAVSAFLAEDVSPAAHGPQGLRVETPW